MGARDWTVEEERDLLESVGHPLLARRSVMERAFTEHANKWGRSPTAPRYKYERLNAEFYANSRDQSK